MFMYMYVRMYACVVCEHTCMYVFLHVYIRIICMYICTRHATVVRVCAYVCIQSMLHIYTQIHRPIAQINTRFKANIRHK
jgi:hypothetical protein